MFNFFLIVMKIFACFVAVSFLLMTKRVLKLIKYQKLLRDMRILSDPTLIWPRVSLIVPVCNEANTIEKAAKSMFLIDYPNIEYIFVNDRSSDNTAEILVKLASTENRMKIITIRHLPNDWLGKVNAFEQGRLEASGEWILFSDADVQYHSTSLKKAMSYSLSNNLDFVCVLPSIVGGTFFVRVLLANIMHYLTLLADFSRISNPKYPDAVGHGAFMLVSKVAYNKSRGLEWLKMEIVDDLGLAVEMKRSGAKIGILGGLDEIEFEWYPNIREFIGGFEKNGFAALQYSFLLLVGLVIAAVLFFLGYTLVPILTGSLFYMAFVWISMSLYLLATAYSLRAIIRLSPFAVLLFPITFLIISYVVVRSGIKCLKQKGIYWRGTFYPLSALKREQRVRIIKISPQGQRKNSV